MPPSLDNPFRKPSRSKKEAEDISELLVGKERKEQEEQKEVLNPIVELSTEEKESAEAAEDKPWTKEQMLKWAQKYKLDASWVDNYLDQDEEGYWHAPNGLNLKFITDPKEIPKGIIEIKGLYILDGLKDIEGISFPENTEFLSLNGVSKVKDLIIPDGVKDIFLEGLQSFEDIYIPESLEEFYFEQLDNEKVKFLEWKYPNVAFYFSPSDP